MSASKTANGQPDSSPTSSTRQRRVAYSASAVGGGSAGCLAASGFAHWTLLLWLAAGLLVLTVALVLLASRSGLAQEGASPFRGHWWRHLGAFLAGFVTVIALVLISIVLMLLVPWFDGSGPSAYN